MTHGDCGTDGKLDMFLDEENVSRIPSPHCNQSFMNEANFDAAMDQDLEIFYLTDDMARRF